MPSAAPRSEPPARRRGDGPGPGLRLLVALVAALAAMAVDLRWGTVGLAPFELQTLDWRFRLRGPERPGGGVVLVLADDASLAELGAWPPPREILAAAVERLAAAGAGTIVVNLLLAERPEALPPSVRDLLAATLAFLPPERDELRVRLEALLAATQDGPLERTLRQAGRVLLPYAFVANPAEANRTPVPGWIEATAFRIHALGPDEPRPFVPQGLLAPSDALGAAALSAGHVSLALEADGSLRADLPAVAYGDLLLPSLALEAARVALGVPRSGMSFDAGRLIRLGSRAVPLDARGRQLIDQYGPEGSLPTYSLRDLLQGRIRPDLLARRVVVLGVSAAGAGDRFATPFAAALPGSEHLATAIDNILTGRVPRRGPGVRAVGLALTGVMALLAALLAGRRSPLWSLGVLLALLAGLGLLLQAAFVTERAWLAALPPAMALFGAGLAVEALRLADERGRRRRLQRQKDNLARYFAPAMVERLAASDRPAGLDRTQEAAVLFVDIVGFTRLSEDMAPAAAMALLRAFHTRVERAVFAHGGMVDKFMGDGALACFGVPDPAPDAAAAAIRAALALLEALASDEATPVRIGIGIHLGPVLVGDIGGDTQFQFTVIGDTVNVASRLEALTRQQDTPLLVSERLFAAAAPRLPPAIAARFVPLPGLALRGRQGELDARRLVP